MLKRLCNAIIAILNNNFLIIRLMVMSYDMINYSEKTRNHAILESRMRFLDVEILFS